MPTRDELDRIEIYRGRGRVAGRKQWRWRYVAAGNNARLGTGGEGYSNYLDCVRAMQRVTGVAMADFSARSAQDSWEVHRSIGETVLVVVKP